MRVCFHHTFFVLPALLATSVSCSGSDSAPSGEQAVLQRAADAVIIEAHDAFVERTAGLESSLIDFCNAPTQRTLSDAQASWVDTMKSLQHVELFSFGPWQALPDIQGAAINTWPVRTGNIEELLTTDEDITEADVAISGSTRRGLPVIEYLLFSSDLFSGEAIPSDELADERCDYLIAAGADLGGSATNLRDDWAPESGNYVAEVINGEGMFMDRHEALSELVNRMWFSIENIRRDSITKALGDNAERAQPYAAEASRADAVNEMIVANIDAIELLFSGNCSNTRATECTRTTASGQPFHEASIAAMLADRGREDVIDSFETELQDASAAAEQMLRPYSAAVVDARSELAFVSEELRDLQTIIQADIINVLGLSISFNDNDGD